MNDADEVTPFPPHRRRSCVWRLAVLLVFAVAASACAAPDQDVALAPPEAVVAAASSDPQATQTAEPAATPTPAETTAAETPAETESSISPTPTPHPLAAADTQLPPAPIGFDQLFTPQGPQPISIEIENIDVAGASVIPVGVNQEDLSFEVPPADQVGWYEFGPRPGEPGSSVLAAHIAYNGVDGVFRYLEDVEVGSVVVIGFDDGSTSRYRIEEVVEYVKEELPDSLFARDGREQLALITCGGAFNHQLDSYESNTVAVAVPI